MCSQFALTYKILAPFYKFENKLSNSDFSEIYPWTLVKLSGIKTDKYWSMIKWPFSGKAKFSLKYNKA